ncbi:MAG: UPF0280 family protein [Candidatus Thermoplasmatota archaeon]|nr:UPF0280 family protein [Candidatus Thermoplasmatota archaeon]
MSEFVTAKLEIEETAATIGAEREHIDAAVTAIKAARREIERQVRRDRFFLTTLEPYSPEPDSGSVVRRMCDAARAAGVGPMAAVAGVIAQEALEAMVSLGCTHGWVDNGGDVAILVGRPVTIEVFHMPDSGSAFALELEKTGRTLGICSSSGTLGHSISFGNADVVVAIAEDAATADALATAVGNRVSGPASLEDCFGPFEGLPGFIGGIAIAGGKVAMHGRIPRLVEAEHNPERVTSHSMMPASKFASSSKNVGEVRS